MARSNLLSTPPSTVALLVSMFLAGPVASAAVLGPPAATALPTDATLAAKVLPHSEASGRPGSGPEPGSPARSGGKEGKSYFSGPIWQDLRLLTSFALGIACVHIAEKRRECESDGSDSALQRAKFEMYPYAL